MERAFRIFVGLLIIAGSIYWAFKTKQAPPSARSTGGFVASVVTENDPLAIPIDQISQAAPKELSTDAQQQIRTCLLDTKFKTQDVAEVNSLETLRGLLTDQGIGFTRERTREVITFQTNDQVRDDLKYRALFEELDEFKGARGWRLFEIAADGLPDSVEMPAAQEDRRRELADLIRGATLLEHDRDELFKWPDGSSAEVKSQDQRITEIAYRFGNGRLLGCATRDASLICLCK